MQKMTKFFDSALQNWQDFFGNYYNFYQLLAFLGILAFCFVLSKIFLKTFRRTKVIVKHKKIMEFLELILFPLLTILFLAVIHIINEQFFLHSYILYFCLKLCFLWGVIRFTKFFPKKNILFTFISISIISLTLLSVMEIEQSLLTFHVGDFSLSIYDLLKSVGITCLLIWLFSQVNTRIEGFIQKQWELPPNSRDLLVKVSNVGIVFIFALICLNILGLDLSKFAFLTGSIGIGVGFGLKNIIANLVSGFILLMDKSIEKGSVVEVDNVAGTISSIGVRNTIVRSFEGKEILIPNEKFVSDKVVNLTLSNRQVRLSVTVGVSYDANPAEVKQILQEALNNNRFVAKNPAARAYLADFGDSSVDFLVLFWVLDVGSEMHQARESVLMDIWDALKFHQIEIPFPQVDVHRR